VVTWRSWWRGHRGAVLNVAIAVVLFGVELGASLLPPAPVALHVLGVVAAVLLGAAALVRRRLPLVFAAAAAFDALVRTDGLVAMPFAGYALGRYQPPGRLRWTAVALTTLAGLQPWSVHSVAGLPGHLAGAGVTVVLPAAVGAWVRTRTELLSALLERAERAEAEQQLQARKAVLEERARIAREMHDVVGHRVSLMVLQAGAIEMASTDPPKVRLLAEQVQQAGRRALEELRQVVGLLRTGDDGEPAPLAPQPTLADLDDLLAGAADAGVEVVLDRRGNTRPIDATVERTAYRVIQEALTNAGKHAPGAAVAITLDYRPAELAVAVVNRRATQPVAALPSGGHGLVGLRERVRALGGDLRAEPRLDGGFAVRAVLPA
jgi:signal transduction histidine kinase